MLTYFEVGINGIRKIKALTILIAHNFIISYLIILFICRAFRVHQIVNTKYRAAYLKCNMRASYFTSKHRDSE